MNQAASPHHDELTQGEIYRVSWRYQAGNGRWVDRQMVASYISYDRVRDELMFSLRPLAGTTGIRLDSLVSVSVLPPGTAKMLPRRVAA